MKKFEKIGSFIYITAAATGAIHIINKTISFLSNDLNTLPNLNSNRYKWKYGNIFYTKQGIGKPLLLVHDLNTMSSDIEWKALIDSYSKDHTVYTIDLLGCGRSEKPAITYTNYLYVQLITDFVKDIIGMRTNVIVTGLSSSIVTMACFLDQTLFDKIIFVNPDSLSTFNKVPTKNSKFAKYLFEVPIIGTLLYNIRHNRTNIDARVKNDYFSNPYIVPSILIDAFHQASHKNGEGAKYLFASIIGNYTNISITRSLKEITNSIYVIQGQYEPRIATIIHEYASVNPSIQTASIGGTKHLPQLERPEEFYHTTSTFLYEQRVCEANSSADALSL